jgi:hypothetical protein
VTQSSNSFPAPTYWYDRLVVGPGGWEDCSGIPVLIAVLRGEEQIRAQIAAALQLIREFAPADFERLGRMSRGIAVGRLYGARAQWRQSIRICVISTHYLRRSDTTAVAIASVIIHELMHARLDALGFDYREEQRARIERLCFRASRRFLERLAPSPDREAALEELEVYMSLESREWSNAALKEAYRQNPWFLRAFRPILTLVTKIVDRGAPT